jgi:putative transposase
VELPRVSWTPDPFRGKRSSRCPRPTSHTREALAIEVDTSLPGLRVTRVLDRVAEQRRYPQQIVIDNGPEFTGRALDAWAYQHGVTLAFIQPGKPSQNAHVESFNGKFRDECLNAHWFLSMAHARQRIEHWRNDYNTVRPHSALGRQTPAEFTRAFTNNGESRTAGSLS